jgi:hypothetical protein
MLFQAIPGNSTVVGFTIFGFATGALGSAAGVCSGAAHVHITRDPRATAATIESLFGLSHICIPHIRILLLWQPTAITELFLPLQRLGSAFAPCLPTD